MKKAVILFNLGGPDKLESVQPFLFNLFNDPDQQDRVRDMAARIRVWQVQTGDTAPIPSTI